MHLVVGYGFLFYGSERSEPDVKRHIRNIYSPRSEVVHLLDGEVKPRSRRGGRTRLAGIDGLVSLFIFKLFGDVRRQRHLADLIKNGKKALLTVKFRNPVAVLHNVEDLSRELSSAEDKSCADLRLFPGAAEDLPDILLFLLKKQEFDEAAV